VAGNGPDLDNHVYTGRACLSHDDAVAVENRAGVDEGAVEVRDAAVDQINRAGVDDRAVDFEDVAVDGAHRAVVGDTAGKDQRTAIGEHGPAGIHNDHTVDRPAAG